jgi:hypothetical protein
MRGTILAAVLAGWLLTTATAQGGLYSTFEPLQALVFGTPAEFRDGVRKLQAVNNVDIPESENRIRAQVLANTHELEAKERNGTLTYVDRINLSAFYVRLNEPNKAVTVLEAIPAHRRDFLALSNLATAYQLLGQSEPAERHLMAALDTWPRVSPWFSSKQLNWLHLVEKYQLQLIRLRQQESQRGRLGAPTVDALFPRVRFIGPSGQYEAGILAADQFANLPAEAVAIVKHLVLWFPHDLRLRWLLAELVNAVGDADGALQLMNEVSNFNSSYRPPELVAHQKVLRDAQKTREALLGNTKELVKETALRSPGPVRQLIDPAAAALLDVVGTLNALEFVKNLPPPQFDPTQSVGSASPAPAPAPEPSRPWTPEWRQIAVSFVAGVVVALLLSLQLRELRKRRQQPDAEPASKP